MSRVTGQIDRRGQFSAFVVNEACRGKIQSLNRGGSRPGVMPKLANDGYLPSPRVRMFLIIGMATLASAAILYVFLSKSDLTQDFLKSHPFPIFVLATLSAIFSAWLQARYSRIRAGLFLRSAGRGLILFCAGAAFFLNLPSAVPASLFALGFVSSVVGGMQFRAARRRDMESQRQVVRPESNPD